MTRTAASASAASSADTGADRSAAEAACAAAARASAAAAPAVVLAVGVADAEGVAGTGGLCADWAALGLEALGTGRTYRALFHERDATFRRLDRTSRALVLAAAAAGPRRLLTHEAREATAIVLETERGALETDLRFARGLRAGAEVEGALFSSTLSSACLGEVALRHGLRGLSLCLSIGPGEEGEALREAVRLLEDGAARAVLACSVEVLAAPVPTFGPALRAVAVLLAPAGAEGPSVAPWPGGADPFGALVACARAGR